MCVSKEKLGKDKISYMYMVRRLSYPETVLLLIAPNVGFAGGGYIHSFGAARLVSELVDECLFPSVTAKL